MDHFPPCVETQRVGLYDAVEVPACVIASVLIRFCWRVHRPSSGPVSNGHSTRLSLFACRVSMPPKGPVLGGGGEREIESKSELLL